MRLLAQIALSFHIIPSARQYVYRELGSGDKSVLFLHGWGCDGSIFENVAKRLKGYQCVLADLPGFGKSESPPESGWRVEDYALSVWYLVQKLQPSPRYIVAHSFGCRVADGICGVVSAGSGQDDFFCACRYSHVFFETSVACR